MNDIQKEALLLFVAAQQAALAAAVKALLKEAPAPLIENLRNAATQVSLLHVPLPDAILERVGPMLLAMLPSQPTSG